MKRLKGAEVWTDQQGTIAVKRLDGDYEVFLSTETVSIEVGGKERLLSDFPTVANHVVKTKIQILNGLRRKLKKK